MNGAWNAHLDALTRNVTDLGATHIGITNEPSTDIPWEYDRSGEPCRTRQVVRQVDDDLYTDTPDDLPGNDDQGALSSWYVWAAVGLYPETPGSADLGLGSPLLPAAAIHTGIGRTVVKSAPAAADAAPYLPTGA